LSDLGAGISLEPFPALWLSDSGVNLHSKAIFGEVGVAVENLASVPLKLTPVFLKTTKPACLENLPGKEKARAATSPAPRVGGRTTI
jgi:hypothetical protein